MNAKVRIEKSFDDDKRFSKELKNGDLEQFFTEEGEYLDRLAKILEAKGEYGEGFTVTYTVQVTK